MRTISQHKREDFQTHVFHTETFLLMSTEEFGNDDDAVGRDEATLDIGNADPTLSIRRISQSKRQHSHSQCGRC
ncbi:unnamed protein product [Tenebrio molitor]|nr:unnamed protein product [Tenebrio molitor]